MLYKIWSEGFMIQGMSTPARAHRVADKVEASSFQSACAKHFKDNADFRFDIDGNPVHWGCRLFDNEADARKNFG